MPHPHPGPDPRPRCQHRRPHDPQRGPRPRRGAFLRGALEALAFPAAFAAVGLAGWAVAGLAVAADAGPPPYPPVLVDVIPPPPDADAEPGPGAPAHPDEPEMEEPEIWLVDGFNVLQVVLLGGQDRSEWWTRPHREALVARVAAFRPAGRSGAASGAGSGAAEGGATGAAPESGAVSEPNAAPEASPGEASPLEAPPLEAPPLEVWVVFDGPRPLPAPESGGAPFVVFAPSADAWILARIREAEAPQRIAVVSADRRLAARARRRGARVIAPAAFLERCPIRGETASA